MNINFGFGPGFVSPEQMEAERQRRLATLRQMVDDKRCIMCKNTFLVNDQITFCMFSKKCVDDDNGMSCEHWEPMEIS